MITKTNVTTKYCSANGNSMTFSMASITVKFTLALLSSLKRWFLPYTFWLWSFWILRDSRQCIRRSRRQSRQCADFADVPSAWDSAVGPVVWMTTVLASCESVIPWPRVLLADWTPSKRAPSPLKAPDGHREQLVQRQDSLGGISWNYYAKRSALVLFF